MIVQSMGGLFLFPVIAWMMSENRKEVRVKIVVIGILVQLVVGAVLLKIPAFRAVFMFLNRLVFSLEEATVAGTSFVFGYLGGGALPFVEKFPGSSFVLAFQALPLVLVISALSALLFYWKILPCVVRAFSWALQRTMKVGGG